MKREIVNVKMRRQLCILIIAVCSSLSVHGQLSDKSFPDDFMFGAATAAYQIEGGWNADGKGENIWDRYTHEKPHEILDGSTGDIACDSYRKYEEDVALLKEMGVQFYRFSLSWSRILPTGFSYSVNKAGVNYYNALIDLLIKNNITPMITLFHWDTPQPLEDIGGFASDLMVDWFEDYARIAFTEFGDRVQLWLTFNEPQNTCLEGYGRNGKAPGYNSSGIGDYLCTHNLLKAHARAYHVYNDEFKQNQKGKVSITLDSYWFEPASDSAADIDAAQRMRDFSFGWFADPIFHPNGDYPKSMRDNVDERSKAEGFSESRLPKFSDAEVAYIKGTYDYFGLNHYTTQLVADTPKISIGEPSYDKDLRVHAYFDREWPSSASTWLKVVPWGFRKLLNYIKTRYGDVEIYVTENGFSDKGELEDYGRIDYYSQYLSELLNSIHEDEVKVKAYAAWSFLDNFEWKDGYVNRLGLYHVDFTKSDRPRTPKASVKFYKEVIANKKLPVEITTDSPGETTTQGVGQLQCANVFSIITVGVAVLWINRN